MSDPAYLAYIDALAHAMYTQDHLENVTFEASFQLSGELPKISPPNSLLQYMFTEKAPETGHSKHIQPWDTEYAVHTKKEVGFKWEVGEEMWLLRLILSGGQKVRDLYRVQRIGTTTFHILAILENETVFVIAVWAPMQEFHVGIFSRSCSRSIRSSLNWVYSSKDNTMDPDTIHLVGLEHLLHAPEQRAQMSIVKVATSTSNPLEVRSQLSKSDTQTLDARTVYHEIQGALKSTMSGIQTKADLDLLKEKLDDIRREMNLEDDEFSIHDPAVKSKKAFHVPAESLVLLRVVPGVEVLAQPRRVAR
ncbi:hypothetical protein BJ165DRAFT_1531978 [Panaeolus papilionaceus]|nr:hypothetical protein BJ165DRAFT_1531978 [Panaeolus papilionaceus]